MTPEQLQRMETLEKKLQDLERVENLDCIENTKRRVVRPVLGEVIRKDSTGNTSGILKSVNEGGGDSYGVAAEYNGSIIVEDINGNQYKIGYYNV